MTHAWHAQAIWQRSALNEKETELLELREQHARLVVRCALLKGPALSPLQRKCMHDHHHSTVHLFVKHLS